MSCTGIRTALTAWPRHSWAVGSQAVVRLVSTTPIGTAPHSKRERLWRSTTPRFAASGFAHGLWREPLRRRRPLHFPSPPRLHFYERRALRRLLLAAIIPVSLLSGTVTAKAEGLWAAFILEEVKDVYCGGRNQGKLGAYGIAWNYETEMAARQAAKEGCEKHTPFCHHEYGFATQSSCLVLAVETTGNRCGDMRYRTYSYGIGDTARAAELYACGNAWDYGRPCEVRVNTCKR